MTHPVHATRIRRHVSSLVAGALVATLAFSACGETPSPTDPDPDPDPVVTTVTPQISLVAGPSDASAAPVDRIRATARRTDGTQLDQSVADVDPGDPWAAQLSITEEDGASLVVYLELIHVEPGGAERLEFSGQSAPFSLSAGTAASPPVPVVRGPFDNLFTESVTITAAPSDLIEGESATLDAETASSNGGSPVVWWTSLDESIVSVDGAVATAMLAGSARLVASAGTFADTAEVVVTAPDTQAPAVVSTTPAASATDVDPDGPITVTFDEAIDPSSVTAATFVLRDSAGVEVVASVSTSEQVATLAPQATLEFLHVYTVELTSGVEDLAGNALVAPVSWSFTTMAPVAGLLGSFNPGIGGLVAIGLDDVSRNLYIYRDKAPAIRVFTPSGTEVGSGFPVPGEVSNEIDFDFLEVAANIDAVLIPTNTLLVHNGEVSPGTLYALDKNTGSILSSVDMPVSGLPVGGAFHTGRETFFSVNWMNNTITEVDANTGAELSSFSSTPVGAPLLDIYFGDIDVDPATGHLLLVSSNHAFIRILKPTGELVRDVPIGAVVNSGVSGLAWDGATQTAWLALRNGTVVHLGGIL